MKKNAFPSHAKYYDEVAQILVALKMEIGLLNRKFNSGIDFSDHTYISGEIVEVINLIDKALKNTRRIMSGLRAEELELLGFIESAKLYINNFRNQYNISCKFKTSIESLQLKPQQTVALYRILQESLMNVAHHSLAKAVNVSIELIDNKLIFEVRDNGAGFDLQNMVKKNSFGLTGIRERAILLEADIKIESIPGKGTTITLEMPFQKLN